MPRYNAGSSQDNSNNAAIDAACGFAKGRRGGLLSTGIVRFLSHAYITMAVYRIYNC